MLHLILFGLRSLISSVSAAEESNDGVTIEDAPAKEAGLPFPGGKMPSPQELLQMLETMGGISDEDKQALRKELLKSAQDGSLPEGIVDGVGAEHVAATSFFASQLFLLLIMLGIIALIFVFFGYKLYKSLSERERKREEKKKNKQMKKKK